MLQKILRLLPVSIANKLVAHVILKSKIKNNKNLYKRIRLKFAKRFFMNLNPSDIGHQYLAFTGVYEYSLTKKISHIIKSIKQQKDNEDYLMVDVGANYGYYSLLWASGGSNYKTISFEASPRNHQALEDNVSLNNLKNQINLEKIALSDKSGIAYFDQGPIEQTGWGGLTHQDGENVTEVITQSLDFYFKNKTQKIEILKIDTEGADYLVIKGAEEFLKDQKIKHIFWEENLFRANQLGLRSGMAIEFLKKMNYHVEKIGDNEFHAFLANKL